MQFTVTEIAKAFHVFEDSETTKDESTENAICGGCGKCGSTYKYEGKAGKRRNVALALATNGNTAIKAHLRKTLGNESEDEMLNMYEKQIKRKIINRNHKVYDLFLSVCGDVLKIRGRIDGFIAYENTVVEHKRRTQGLLHAVPYHERVQCHFYMMMTGADTAHLLETFGNHMQVHVIPFDDDVWEQIYSRIASNFISKFSKR